MISFIIVNYKTPELLKLCLKSITKECGDFDHEIIVVDIESDGEAEMMLEEQYPSVEAISVENNIGYAGGVNLGIRKAQGKYFFILNTDIVIKKGSVERLIDFMEKNNKVGLAGPRLINFNETIQPSAFRFYTVPIIFYRRTFLRKFSFAKKALNKFLLKDKLNGLECLENEFCEVDWIMGSAMFVKRAAVREVGLMDEQFFMYFEDVDWCKRFWEAGWRVVYYSGAEMYHYHIKGSKRGNMLCNKLAKVHIQSAFKYFRKHGARFR